MALHFGQCKDVSLPLLVEACQQDSTPTKFHLSEETFNPGKSACAEVSEDRRRNETFVCKVKQFEHQVCILVVLRFGPDTGEHPSSGVCFQGEILTLCELFDRRTGETLIFSPTTVTWRECMAYRMC